jgi:hypothetical protein
MELKDKFVHAEPSSLGDRFCSTCYQYKTSHGGKWKIAAHGKNRRWICEECMTKKVKPTPIK